MRLAGVGVDVVDVARLARVRVRQPAILTKVCAPEEEPESANDLRAARLWAGKEAVAKTLGTGFWQRGVDWLDIVFRPDGSVRLSGRARELAGEGVIAVDFTRLGDALLAVALRWTVEL